MEGTLVAAAAKSAGRSELGTTSFDPTEESRNVSPELSYGISRRPAVSKRAGRGAPPWTLTFIVTSTLVVAFLIFRCLHMINNDSRLGLRIPLRLLSEKLVRMNSGEEGACSTEPSADESGEQTPSAAQDTEVSKTKDEAKEHRPLAESSKTQEAAQTSFDANTTPAAGRKGSDHRSRAKGTSRPFTPPDERSQSKERSPLHGSAESPGGAAGGSSFPHPEESAGIAAGPSGSSGAESASSTDSITQPTQGDPSAGSGDRAGSSVDPEGSSVDPSAFVPVPGFDAPISVWKASGLPKAIVRSEKIRRRAAVAKKLEEEAQPWKGTVKWEDDEMPRDLEPLDDDVFT